MVAIVRFAESEPDANMGLYSFDAKHQFFFDVQHYVTIGQVAKRFQQAAFDKYQTNDMYG